jgi:hypothetical protein
MRLHRKTNRKKHVRSSFGLEHLLLAFTLNLSACTIGHLFEDSSPGSPNVRPADYKSDILAMLRVYLNDPTQIRDAAVSEPMLQPIGKGERYIVCLRLNAKKNDRGYAGAKEYVAVFAGGRLDQLVEAKREQCDLAVYQPFPEAETLTR